LNSCTTGSFSRWSQLHEVSLVPACIDSAAKMTIFYPELDWSQSKEFVIFNITPLMEMLYILCEAGNVFSNNISINRKHHNVAPIKHRVTFW
jgi:hypothetical protein